MIIIADTSPLHYLVPPEHTVEKTNPHYTCNSSTCRRRTLILAFILPRRRKVISKLHPQPRFRHAPKSLR